MKKAIILAASLLASGLAYGEDVATSSDAVKTTIAGKVSEASGGLVDVTAFLKSARVGIAWTAGDEESWKLAYVPTKSWFPDTVTELINLDIGGIVKDDRAGGCAMIGLRLDSLGSLITSGSYAKEHIKSAILPTIEIPAGYAVITRSGYKPEYKLIIGVTVGFK